jgi:UDP-N-acetylglucosamine--N-acetylmuramyl-(pentapeptide) pyrophosphoryl-undecaprenol N-acetylglucosamine transferase
MSDGSHLTDRSPTTHGSPTSDGSATIGPTRIALAAGGTAGHVYPALAVAEALRERGGRDIRFIGTEHGVEVELLRGCGFPLMLVPGQPWQNRGLRGRGSASMAAIAGVFAARRLLRQHAVQAVIGFGGYASVGAILAARSLGLWTAIVEPNVEIGMANRLLARMVERLYAGTDTHIQGGTHAVVCRTGAPLRNSILQAAAQRGEPRTGAPARVLVLGDPAHSQFLDDHVPELLRKLAALGIALEVRHQTNAESETEVARRYGDVPCRVTARIDDMAKPYGEADFVIGRSGAGTLAELAACGIPALLIPLARAAEGHQSRNASVYAASGAAFVCEEAGWNGDRLAAQLATLLRDPHAWREMAGRAREHAALSSTAALIRDVECRYQSFAASRR